MPNKIIAVTGGIGSGKSETIRIIKELGYKVYSLDEIYSDLLQNYDFLKKVCAILQVFPTRVIGGGWTFDRRAAAKKAFSDAATKEKLNAFTHPAIIKEFKARAERENGTVFCEVPLLFESGLEREFDKVIVLIRPISDRINGVKIRDGLNEEEIISRIKNQFDYANFLPDKHTIVIENVSDRAALEEKVKSVIENLD